MQKLCRRLCRRLCIMLCKRLCRKLCRRLCRKLCIRLCRRLCIRLCRRLCSRICKVVQKLCRRLCRSLCIATAGPHTCCPVSNHFRTLRHKWCLGLACAAAATRNRWSCTTMCAIAHRMERGHRHGSRPRGWSPHGHTSPRGGGQTRAGDRF